MPVEGSKVAHQDRSMRSCFPSYTYLQQSVVLDMLDAGGRHSQTAGVRVARVTCKHSSLRSTLMCSFHADSVLTHLLVRLRRLARLRAHCDHGRR